MCSHQVLLRLSRTATQTANHLALAFLVFLTTRHLPSIWSTGHSTCSSHPPSSYESTIISHYRRSRSLSAHSLNLLKIMLSREAKWKCWQSSIHLIKPCDVIPAMRGHSNVSTTSPSGATTCQLEREWDRQFSRAGAITLDSVRKRYSCYVAWKETPLSRIIEQNWHKNSIGSHGADFPEQIRRAVARTTEKLTFAHLKELFFTSLLLFAGSVTDDLRDQKFEQVVDSMTDSAELDLSKFWAYGIMFCSRQSSRRRMCTLLDSKAGRPRSSMASSLTSLASSSCQCLLHVQCTEA